MKTRTLWPNLIAGLILTTAGCPARTPADRGGKTIKAPGPAAASGRLAMARELLGTVPAGSTGLLILDLPGIYRLWDDVTRLARRTPIGTKYLQMLKQEAAKTKIPWPWSIKELASLGLDSSGPALIYGERKPVMVLPVLDAEVLRRSLARLTKTPNARWLKKTVKGRIIHSMADMHCHVERGRMTCSDEQTLLATLQQKPGRTVWDDFREAERADLAGATVAFFIKSRPYLGTGSARVEDDGISARVRVEGGTWEKFASYYKGLRKRDVLGLARGSQSTMYFRFDLAPLMAGEDKNKDEVLRTLGLDAEKLQQKLTGEVMLLERKEGLAVVIGCRDRSLSKMLVGLMATIIQKEASKKGGIDGKKYSITMVPGSGGSDYRVSMTSTNPAVPLSFQGRLRAGRAGVLIGTEELVLALADSEPPTLRSFEKGLSTAAAREAFGPQTVIGLHSSLSDPVEVLTSRYPQMMDVMKKLDPKVMPFVNLGRLLMDQLHELTFGTVRDGKGGLRMVLRVSTLHRHGQPGDDAARELWIKGIKAKLAGDRTTYEETVNVLAARHHGSRYGDLKASRLEGKGAVAATMGILAAVAIPAFIKYTRKSKTVEATEALDKIGGGARAYYVTDHWDRNGNLMPKRFPPSVPMTPTKIPGCNKKLTPAITWSSRGWDPLYFALTEPHYYSYSFQSSGTGAASVYTARAHGDLDCDGTLSTFEIRGSVDSDGSVSKIGPIITNEIE